MKKSKQEFYRISINFPPEMEKILQDRAKENGRSLSREVIQLVKAQLALETKKEPIATALSER